MSATRDILVRLLIEARRLDNLTVKSSEEVAAWRLAVDRALQGEPGDKPEDRYGTPERNEYRRFVESLSTRRRL
jgi:hypothetical protein